MLAFGDIGSELALHSSASVVLTPHRFSLPEFLAYEPSVGRFNAGFVAFNNVRDGREALNWWMNRCLEGCPARPDGDRYADQKYLNAIPKMFRDVAVSEVAGAQLCAVERVRKECRNRQKAMLPSMGCRLSFIIFKD